MNIRDVLTTIGFIVGGLTLICGGCYAIPQYRVWQKGLSGQAELKEAEWNRQIKLKEAEVKKDSAAFNAEAKLIEAKGNAAAEIERARGVAEANKIIGQSLKGNESYLRYLWIQGLQDGSSEVIYIPTEGNLPILEATRGNR